MGQWVGFAIGLFVGTAFGTILAGLLAGMKRHEWPDVPVEKARREEA